MTNDQHYRAYYQLLGLLWLDEKVPGQPMVVDVGAGILQDLLHKVLSRTFLDEDDAALKKDSIKPLKC